MVCSHDPHRVEFTAWLRKHLDDAAYARFQQDLAEHPLSGTVMPGCGGLRKIRIADPARQQGKRGGARVVYLYVPEAGRIYLLDAYGKNEKVDLAANEKKILRQLAEEHKAEAIKAAGAAEKASPP